MSADGQLCFDGERLRRRRFDLGLSETALSRSLGVSPMTLRHIEQSGPISGHTMRFVVAYAASLGLHPLDVFIDDRGPVAGPGLDPVEGDAASDVGTVGATLVGSFGTMRIDGLAQALEWSPERTRLALDGLAAVAPALGMRVVIIGDTDVLLAPAEGHTEAVAVEAFGTIEECGLGVADFRLVSRLARTGRSTYRKQTSDQTMRRLVAADIVETGRSGTSGYRDVPKVAVGLTDRTLFDLCLTDTPPGGATP